MAVVREDNWYCIMFSLIESEHNSIKIVSPADELNQLVTVKLPDESVPLSCQAKALSPSAVFFF